MIEDVGLAVANEVKEASVDIMLQPYVLSYVTLPT